MAFDKIDRTNQEVLNYFSATDMTSTQKHYLAVRYFFIDDMPIRDICIKIGCTKTTLYAIIRRFVAKVQNKEEPFFLETRDGRPRLDRDGYEANMIVELRKKNLSVPEIKARLDAANVKMSLKTIFTILEDNGFAKMRRRDRNTRLEAVSDKDIAEIVPSLQSGPFSFESEDIWSDNAGVLLLWPIIKKYGIDQLIVDSGFPESDEISKLASVLSFVALKAINISRYNEDCLWRMDRGLGLFAGLNVLPESDWFNSYSTATSRESCLDFTRDLNARFEEMGLFAKAVSLDLAMTPCRGIEGPASASRNVSKKNKLGIHLSQGAVINDPLTGLIYYGSPYFRQSRSDEFMNEFLTVVPRGHFEAEDSDEIRHVVMDRSQTTYDHIGDLARRNVKFLLIKSKSHKILKDIYSVVKSSWFPVVVKKPNNSNRFINVVDREIMLYAYLGLNDSHVIRQILVQNGEFDCPTVIYTNDFQSPVDTLIRRYASRWLNDGPLAQQIGFFNLNTETSGLSVSNDFDFTMSLLAYNLYRLFALELPQDQRLDAATIFNKIILNTGHISITPSQISVRLKKGHFLKSLFERPLFDAPPEITWLSGQSLKYLSSIV
ncbi:MAG: hypothetical protein LBO66_06180 [Deltaproteobacteria bacterium]|jgi:hypothetical protein|nr:hypothetical protein [Deltaproteobacteria bacterium]